MSSEVAELIESLGGRDQVSAAIQEELIHLDGLFTKWWVETYGTVFDDMPGSMKQAFQEVARCAFNSGWFAE